MKTIATSITAAAAVLGCSTLVPAPASAISAQLGCIPTEASDVPDFLFVVGRLQDGSPDPAGLATIVVRDFAGNPWGYMQVSLDFSACCDVRLCPTGPGCDCATRTLRGFTDASGAFTFTVLGAGTDPGDHVQPDLHGGCSANQVIVRSGRCGEEPTIEIGRATAVLLDQNGGAGGSNGVTTSDVSTLLTLFGATALGASYRGRGDIDADGRIGTSDVSALLQHVGRLGLVVGVGCSGTFCERPACP